MTPLQLSSSLRRVSPSPLKAGSDMIPYSIPPETGISPETERDGNFMLSPSPPGENAEDITLKTMELALEKAPFGLAVIEPKTLQISTANQFARDLYHRLTNLPGAALAGRRLDEVLPWLDARGLLG